MTDTLKQEIARAIGHGRMRRCFGEEFGADWDGATDEEREPWLAAFSAAISVAQPWIEGLVFSEAIKRGVDQDTADQVAQAVAAALTRKETEA